MKKVGIFALFLILLASLAACGSSDPAIQVYTRDTTSGTREAFFKGIDFADAVESNDVLAAGYVEVASNGDMLNSLENDEFGIGYISLSTLVESGLKGLSYEGVVASETNVLNNTYGLKRPFMYMTRASDDTVESATVNALAQAFVAYMETSDGKAIIKANGGIVEISSSDPSWDDIKANYPVTELDNSGVTVKFGGSTSVEEIAKALSAAFAPLAGNFTPEHNHTGSGDCFKRVQGSESEGANLIDVGFASRDFSTDELAGAEDGSYGQLAWDAVVAVVSPDNAYLSNITAEQLKAVYSGEITLWSELAA